MTIKEAGDGSVSADVVVLNPRTGEEHRFTPDEYLICRAAAEETTIRGVREKYRTETGHDIPLIELIAFFRSLQSKGLLDDSDGGSMAADGDRELHVATPAELVPMKAVDDPSPQALDRAESGSALEIASPSLTQDQNSAADQSTGLIFPFQAWAARRARRRAIPPQNGAAEEDAGTAIGRHPSNSLPRPPAGRADQAQPDDFDDLEDIDDIGSMGFGGRARRGRPGPDFAAGMAANDGGSGFDLRAGALGGMGAGMGAGFARRLQDGSRGENFAGAGRNRALIAELMRARTRGEEVEPERGPSQISLFDPNALLGVLCVLFWPLKYLYLPLLALLVPMGALIAVERRENLVQDLAGLMDLSVIATGLASLLIINLASRLAQAAVIRGFGGEVRRLGITLVFGFLPRFTVDRSAVGQLSRRGQLWAHAAPLCARLALCSGGLLHWAIYRQTGTLLPEITLLVGVIGMWAFLLSACPLIPSDGYRWLATYLMQPMLRERAMMALKAKFAGHPLPPTITREEMPGLIFFGIGSILACAALALTLLLYAGTWLIGEYRGLGMVFALALCVSFLLWFTGLRHAARRQGGQGFDNASMLRLLAGDPEQAELTTDKPATIATRGRVLWALIGFALLAVAFLPYRYEPGGSFEITPTARSTATARTEGELVEVFVREGSSVKQGEVVAQLSSWSQQRDVDVMRAELMQAQAELKRLEDSPTEEDLALSESKVESARIRTTYKEAQAKRYEELVKTDVVSKSDWEKAVSDYDTSLADLRVAEAELQLVRRGPTEPQIDAARAEVDRLKHELSYKLDQLERTRIRAPTDGRVVTPNIHLLQGTWLQTGVELLRIENAQTIEAMIDVPEADIAFISVADTLRLKPWEDSDVEIAAVVTEISPIAEDRGYGKVVRVRAPIQNEFMSLRPGMTGYAKFEGSEMRVWEAYLRFFVQFIRVEVWSWIP